MNLMFIFDYGLLIIGSYGTYFSITSYKFYKNNVEPSVGRALILKNIEASIVAFLCVLIYSLMVCFTDIRIDYLCPGGVK